VLRAVTSPVDRLISPGSPPEKPPAWPPSAADPNHLGARIAITSVLHTWGSAMTHHPHVHMIVPGGGLSMAGERWIAGKPNFFLPVLVLEALPPRDAGEARSRAHGRQARLLRRTRLSRR
jgi:Putative transposase